MVLTKEVVRNWSIDKLIIELRDKEHELEEGLREQELGYVKQPYVFNQWRDETMRDIALLKEVISETSGPRHAHERQTGSSEPSLYQGSLAMRDDAAGEWSMNRFIVELRDKERDLAQGLRDQERGYVNQPFVFNQWRNETMRDIAFLKEVISGSRPPYQYNERQRSSSDSGHVRVSPEPTPRATQAQPRSELSPLPFSHLHQQRSRKEATVSPVQTVLGGVGAIAILAIILFGILAVFGLLRLIYQVFSFITGYQGVF